METPARRWALLLPALAILTVSLLACQVPSQSAAQGNSISPTSLTMSPPAAGSASATPTFAPFTIGAWPSNAMPDANDRMVIYIICRMQDPTMTGPSTPSGGMKVRVRVLAPINRSYSGTTNGDGMASVPIAFTDAHPGPPVTVDVAATWHDMTYQSQTSFTPASGGQPPQPSGSGPPRHGGTPTPKPTLGAHPRRHRVATHTHGRTNIPPNTRPTATPILTPASP